MFTGLRITNRHSGLVRHSRLLLGLLGLATAAMLGTAYLSPPSGDPPDPASADAELDTVEQLRGPILEPLSAAPESHLAVDQPPRTGTLTVAGGRWEPGIVAPAPRPVTGRLPPRPVALQDDFVFARDILADLAEIGSADGASLSAEEIALIEQKLRALRRGGLDAVIAIEDYLETGEDVDFSRSADTDDLPFPTLRLAILNTLARMPGPDALDAMVGVLAVVTDPREIRVLADGLDLKAPEQYRTEIVAATRDTLTLAIDTDPRAYPGLRHLVGVIETYGDETLAMTLEDIYTTEESRWADYALMALSKLPEGQGVPYLLGIAEGIAAAPDAEETEYRAVLRMLAQASRREPEAETAILDIAERRTLSIPDIKALAATLSGWEHELITPGSEAAERFESALYLNGKAPATWTDAEIEQRIAMVDQLRRLQHTPEAERALLEASETLAAWKERPMLNGTRVDR